MPRFVTVPTLIMNPVAEWSVDSELYLRGIKLFNSAAFFGAHEVLEDVWRAAPEPERKFLQGVIQVAVALYHHGNGNLVGAILTRPGVQESVRLSGKFRRNRVDPIAAFDRSMAACA